MADLRKLVEQARDFRKNMTHTEAMMWSALRRHKQRGLKFRRQHYIIGFIVDFYCAEHKLIVEIDGEVHDDEHVKTSDLIRQNALESAGFRVIRFTAKDVELNIDGVISCILIECGEQPLPQTFVVKAVYVTSP